MTAITAKTTTDTSVSSPTPLGNAGPNTSGVGTKEGTFEAFMKTILKGEASSQVSEEELFAGVIGERLSAKNPELATKYKELLDKEKAARTKPDGYVPVEDAAKAALATLARDGGITEEDGNKIYSESFAAAQLDSNTSALFDGKGGPGDPTIAVETMEKALLAAKLKLEQFASGGATFEDRQLGEASATAAQFRTGGVTAHSSVVSGGSTTPQGTFVDGGGGFLFKPVSDSDGKLAILAPEKLTGLVEKTILMADGKEIESGRYSGNGNGGREHFRFSRPGGGYPKELTVAMILKNGEEVTYKISDPSQRYD